jgi:serine/threonine protein kinase/class 3 adenylate cyclase
MPLDQYRLRTQIGAGKDGVAYRAQAGNDGPPVEVRVLTGAAAPRRETLARQLRLAALLKHPAAVRVLELGLEHEPPYVVLEWTGGKSLADDLAGRVPLPVEQVLDLARELAGGLAAAHRLGLVHGRLSAATVRRTDAGALKTDYTSLETLTAGAPHPPAEWDGLAGTRESSLVLAPQPPTDIHNLGTLLHWLLNGGSEIPNPAAEGLRRLIQEMRAPDPADRPLAGEVEDRLASLVGPAVAAVSSLTVTSDQGLAPEAAAGVVQGIGELPTPRQRGPAALERVLARGCLGRFTLREKLGEGGMGAVFRAEDPTDGSVVAIKVLGALAASRPEAVHRFLKEARLLAEVNNPYVTNLLEVNEDDGVLYLVLEFVPGPSLGRLLDERGRLDERTALTLLADVCRALVEAHERGIVHRDIKPDNILLTGPELAGARLSDFGLARHRIESESLQVTHAGALLGTPLYMSPEQCAGAATDPRSDVYSLGATLFHLLAGRPPFLADTPQAVMALHCNEPPPPLRKLNPALSEAVCRVVEKALAKSPDARYPSAGAMLLDLERLLRGEPTSLAVHPRLPACDPRRLVEYDFTWELEASPQQLWPYVANTDRLNRAAGLPAVSFTTRADPDNRVRVHATLRKLGLTVAYEEHPFEWVEAQRHAVLREFSQGPIKWLVNVVELSPRLGGGTLLAHRVRLEPRGLVGRTAAAVQVGIQGRRALDRIYRRVDAFLAGRLGDRAVADAFEKPAALSAARSRRLQQLLDRLIDRGIAPPVVESLGAFLAQAPAQEVARIRPLALARRLGLDANQVVAACLHGAREGLLVLLWDILCPICRIPSDVKDTLRALREHGQCPACNQEFELDFASSVELIFRAHPEVRDAELATYCIGGPAHSPHVVAQVRLRPGERMELDLALAEGAYRLRGPQLPAAHELRVHPAAPAGRWEVNLARLPGPAGPPLLRSGRQSLALTNDTDQELLLRLERTAPRDDALTAARASALALFRELFPEETLSPGQLISVATVTLLVTDLERAADLYEELGDARAFALVHEHFLVLEERIRREGGALVKTLGEGVLAAFGETAAAVRVGLDLQGLLAERPVTWDLRVRVAVHRGPALAATINDHLDYFGSTVSQAMKVLERTRGGELILSQAVAADPQVAALLHARGLEGEVLPPDSPGQPGLSVLRVATEGTTG